MAWVAAIEAAMVTAVFIAGVLAIILQADFAAALAVAIIWAVDFTAVRVVARAEASEVTAASVADTAADIASNQHADGKQWG
jgi:hypothetical protein